MELLVSRLHPHSDHISAVAPSHGCDGWLAQRQLGDLRLDVVPAATPQTVCGREWSPPSRLARQPAGAMSAPVYWLDTGLPILAQSGLPLPGFPAIA